MGECLAIIVESVRPPSYNATRKDWFPRVIVGAVTRWHCPMQTAPRLYCKVFYFHLGARTVDADNLSKPVLDALKGCVYEDDSQVALRIAAKVDLAYDDYGLTVSAQGREQYDELQRLISSEDRNKDILYVEVGELARIDLQLGLL